MYLQLQATDANRRKQFQSQFLSYYHLELKHHVLCCCKLLKNLQLKNFTFDFEHMKQKYFILNDNQKEPRKPKKKLENCIFVHMMSLYTKKRPKIISEQDRFNLDQCALAIPLVDSFSKTDLITSCITRSILNIFREFFPHIFRDFFICIFCILFFTFLS